MTKPKVFIIQKAGEHALNQNFREALCFKRAFDRLGIESTVYGKGYPNGDVPFETASTGYDIILVLENYNLDDSVPDISKSKAIKCFWSIDSHMNGVLDAHKAFVKKNKIDAVLNANIAHTKEYPENFSAWFPNAFDETIMYPMPEIPKNVNIGFCGNIQNRGEILDNLTQQVGLKQDIFVIGENMVKAVNGYKIHFNKNVVTDINYRTFETCGMKTLLLTNYSQGLEILFEPNEEIVVYYTENELLEKIKELIENTELRERIAKAGYERVLRDHTYFVRAQQLLDVVKKVKASFDPKNVAEKAKNSAPPQV